MRSREVFIAAIGALCVWGAVLVAQFYAARADALEHGMALQMDVMERRVRQAQDRFEGVREACRSVLEVKYPQ